MGVHAAVYLSTLSGEDPMLIHNMVGGGGKGALCSFESVMACIWY